MFKLRGLSRYLMSWWGEGVQMGLVYAPHFFGLFWRLVSPNFVIKSCFNSPICLSPVIFRKISSPLFRQWSHLIEFCHFKPVKIFIAPFGVLSFQSIITFHFPTLICLNNPVGLTPVISKHSNFFCVFWGGEWRLK